MWIFILIVLILVYFTVTWIIQCKKNRLLNLPKKMDIINLGSTYAYYDFSYKDSAFSGGNLANVPQYLDMDMVLLKKYIKRMNKKGKVLIVLPNFVFAGDLTVTNYNRKVYFEALPFWKIKHFSIVVWWNTVWKAAKEPFTHAYKREEQKWEGYVASQEEKEQHARNRVKDWEKKLKIPDVRTGAITGELLARIEDNIKIVNDIIDLCRKKELEPILIIPPVSEIMHKMVSDECLNIYLRTPVKTIAKEKQVRVYDYGKEEKLLDSRLYLNSDCLNAEGQKVFMDLLLQDVNQNICGIHG